MATKERIVMNRRIFNAVFFKEIFLELIVKNTNPSKIKKNAVIDEGRPGSICPELIAS